MKVEWMNESEIENENENEKDQSGSDEECNKSSGVEFDGDLDEQDELEYDERLDYYVVKDKHKVATRFVLKGDLEALKEMLLAIQTTSSPADRDKLINQRNIRNGRSILHEACVRGHKDIVKYLLQETDCRIDIRTILGNLTPLHLAVMFARRSTVFQLLAHGADPMARDQQGSTPLHYVTTKPCAKLLIDFGAKASAVNRKGKNTHVSSVDRKQEKEVIYYLLVCVTKEHQAEQERMRAIKAVKVQAAREQAKEVKKRYLLSKYT